MRAYFHEHLSLDRQDARRELSREPDIYLESVVLEGFLIDGFQHVLADIRSYLWFFW